MGRRKKSNNDADEQPGVDFAALIRSLDPHLRRAIYSVISNFEAVPDADRLSERRALHASGLFAARKLDYTHQKLCDLSHIALHEFVLSPTSHSLHSVVREAMLFATAQQSAPRRPFCEPSFSGAEPIVQVDADVLVRLLASLLVAVSSELDETALQLSFNFNEEEGALHTRWHLMLQAGQESTDWPSILTAVPHQSHQPAALHTIYWQALAAVLEVQVFVEESSNALVVEHRAPLIRLVPEATRPPERHWTASTVVVFHEPPSDFTPLRGRYTVSPPERDINAVVTESNARLVILHDAEDDPAMTRQNLSACHQLEVPTLLRATNLSYELYNRYKQHVNAIVLEPSEEAVLARYVAGLAGRERRTTRRVAEIH